MHQLRENNNIDLPTKSKRTRSTFPFGKCKVCNDQATGFHYGVESCEGCKGFYKRSVLKNETYHCYFGKRCELRPENRNRCKACRLKRCVEVGMNLDSVKMGRIPKLVREKVLSDRVIEQSSNGEESNTKSTSNRQSSNNSSISNISIDLLEELPSSTSSNDILSSIKTNECVSNESIYSVECSLDKDDDILEIDEGTCDNPQGEEKLILNYEHPHMNSKSTLETITEFAHSIYKLDTVHIKKLVSNAHNIINSGVVDYDTQKITHEMVWSGITETIRDHVRCFVKITNDLPGFRDSFTQNDLSKFIDLKIYDYCSIKNAVLAINDEFYLIFNNGIKYTRSILAKVSGKEIAERTFSLYKSLSDLHLSDREYALLVPYVLSIPSTDELKTNQKLCKINEIFGRALAQELFAYKRSQSFVQKLYHILTELINLSEIDRTKTRFRKPIFDDQ